MSEINSELSLSTSWCASKYTSGKAMVEDIINMGYKQIELNYLVTEKMLQEIRPYVEKGLIKISSVHHPMPKVTDETYGVESIMLGFQDDKKREKAIELTKKTIDIAVSLGAKAVVIHPTQVPIIGGRDYDHLLSELYSTGKKNTLDYKTLYNDMIEYRQINSYKYLSKTKDSLEQIANYILEKQYDIKLGIENRAHCHQIPDFYEAEYLLKGINKNIVGFWYDIGHGIMMENLGMFRNISDMHKIKHRIIGVHIHDAIGMDDHHPPYSLSHYLDQFIEVIQETNIKVLEISDKHSMKSVIAGGIELSNRL